jgi:hypothetical protein
MSKKTRRQSELQWEQGLNWNKNPDYRNSLTLVDVMTEFFASAPEAGRDFEKVVQFLAERLTSVFDAEFLRLGMDYNSMRLTLTVDGKDFDNAVIPVAQIADDAWVASQRAV